MTDIQHADDTWPNGLPATTRGSPTATPTPTTPVITTVTVAGTSRVVVTPTAVGTVTRTG